jgi:hypothetical protein
VAAGNETLTNYRELTAWNFLIMKNKMVLNKE